MRFYWIVFFIRLCVIGISMFFDMGWDVFNEWDCEGICLLLVVMDLFIFSEDELLYIFVVDEVVYVLSFMFFVVIGRVVVK